MTLLLKQLHIHGFKSFATPTTFVFDRGITAVIGPNGSGKSNVAEALRWVLGEQGYANLRSRRTEDIIFAGSDRRAQLSMAEVVLTLDNSDGDLPLPFSEITVARRAYRTGENQYLINGNRVRLKDIQQLVAPLGQSYTIIGQGLVDIALSQKPEERRGLFEHAAGISGLRLRANEAERSLMEALGNAQRLRDILSELEPRVHSLERSARLAREYGSVRDRLHVLQRRYYARLWLEQVEKLAAARTHLREVDATLQTQELTHAEAAQRVGALRSAERRLADTARELAEAVAAHERALADARHRLELFDMQRQAAETRLADLRSQTEEAERERRDTAAEIERLSDASARVDEQIMLLEHQQAKHDERLSSLRQQRAEAQRQLSELDRQLVDNSRTVARIEGQRNVIREQQRTLEADIRRIAVSIQRERQRRDQLANQVASTESRLRELQADATQIEAEIPRYATLVEAALAQVAETRSEINAAEREHASLQHRYELLERSHAGGDGLYAGVRAVLRASRKGELSLPGLIGTLAETIEVPKAYETAIEVALGGHVQDIIVVRWSDAQTAIEFLKRSNAGRATFQPLDTVRAGRRPAIDLRDPDLLGVAADLVTFPEHVASVVEQTLGRTLIVANLDAARRILRRVSGWTLVTLAGEITRSSGSVTGGGRAAEGGLLARERERRTLPGHLGRLEARLSELQPQLEQHLKSVNDLDAERRARQTLLDKLRLEARDLNSQLERVSRDLMDSDESMRDMRTREQELESRRAEVAVAESRARKADDDARADGGRLREEREHLARLLTTMVDDDAELSALRTEIATVRERQRATQTTLRRAEERLVASTARVASRRAEIERITAGTRDHDRERALAECDVARIEGLLASARAELPPVEQHRADVAKSLASAERELDRATELLREVERERDRAALSLARVQDEQVFLVERIRNDLDLDDPAELEGAIIDDGDLPGEQEIARLRERLRRMSVVGEDVLEQYEAESERLSFLRGQLADVDEAADGLRKVLAELNAKMTELFNDTFRDVAAAFEQTFTRLFGGGSARLVMNTTEDGTSGIDIVAQPPGKRLQNLNALSGGERALTAVALLIAIQRVNPSPFCLLDEVDAALDESNVMRFRDEIRDLAGATQFVIITHNRGTIEGADTLYGVTMGADSVSRVLSLRLNEAVRAVDEYAATNAAG